MAAVVSAFLATWIVVPAPSILLLAIAVVVSEESPVFFVAFAFVFAAALFLLRGGTRVVCAVLGAYASVAAIVPLAQLPATARACDEAFHVSGSAGSPFDLARAFGIAHPASPVMTVANVPILLRDGSRSALDLYRPRGAALRPAVIVIYGGAWQFGSRASSRTLAMFLAAHGFTAIAVDYRHAPRNRFPVQIDDVRDALSAIARHAAAWGVDRGRVALAGESAGAELALLAAYAPEPLHVRAAVGFYAPLDLAEGYRDVPVPDPADVRAMLRAYLGGTPAGRSVAYAAASPRSLVRRGLPATLLIGGERDELVDIRFQREMAAALRRAGDSVVSLEFPWSNHGFMALPGGLGGQLASAYTERFFAETLER